MASDDDIEKLKAQNFEKPIKHIDEVGPVGNLFESCVEILRSLSNKARDLDAASRKNHHSDGPQRSESANTSSSDQNRNERQVRKMAKPGCMTCKRRKRKCDEGKPECNNCVRGGFICAGYIIKSTQQKPEASNSNPLGQGTETFPKSRQPLLLDGATSQLLVKTLESNVATLLFWDDEFGALSGHLDKALEHSEENRDLTLATLISLADFLSHDLLNATLPLPADRDDIRQKSNIHARIDKARGIIMDTEAPDREETKNIQDVCEILDSKVARFNVLGPILEESIPSGAAFEQVAAHGQLDDRPAHQYYADQISIRFPNANASLVEVLGKCNWERYMRIHKKREENTQREGSPIGETENMSKFHDSGLGTSVPTQSAFGVLRGSFVYAETEVSKRAEASHRRLPPLPEEGRRGWPFVCDICNSIVRIRRTGAWKKHVFSDVLAYVCIFDDCPSDRCFFEDRDALTTHLGNQHGFAPTWNSAICPLCLEETGDGMNAISLHFTRHMEEVALGAIPRTAESDAGSDESSTMASSENGRSNSFELDEESRDLKAHMLTHMVERPEKCPITTCEYHLKGFAKKYDKKRHTLTHYKGTMVCGFCSGSGSATEKSFNRVDIFKRHLTSVHGVEQTIPNSRKKMAYNSTSAAGTCSTCSVTFADAREFYLHLDDCIFRVVQQADPGEAINQDLLSGIKDDEDVKETLDRHLLPNEITMGTKKHDDDEEKNSHQPSQADPQQQSKEGFSGHDALNPLSEGKEEPEPDILRCACGYLTDEGTSVQCDVCRTWQHLLCYYDDEEQLPETHICVDCQPRPIDQSRIKKHQEALSNIIYTTERRQNYTTFDPFDPSVDVDTLTTQPQGRASSQTLQSHPVLVDDGGMAAHMTTKQALMDQHHDNFEVPSNDNPPGPICDPKFNLNAMAPAANTEIPPLFSKTEFNDDHLYEEEIMDPNVQPHPPNQQFMSPHIANLQQFPGGLNPAVNGSPHYFRKKDKKDISGDTTRESSRNLLTDRLQAAHQARSMSPDHSSRGMNPFKQGSPLAPQGSPSDTISSTQMHQAATKQLGGQQKAEDDNESYQRDENARGRRRMPLSPTEQSRLKHRIRENF